MPTPAPPQDAHARIPRTCEYVLLHTKMVLADVVKLRMLKLGRLL